MGGNSRGETSQPRKQSSTKSPTCDHCKKIGHIKEKCWKLHPE